MYFGMLTQNRIIDAALLAWFLAQLIKVIIDLILIRKFDLKRFVSSGAQQSLCHGCCLQHRNWKNLWV